MGRKYRSEIAEGIHESARDLFEIGLISEAEMKEFDKTCLVEKSATDTAPEFPDAKTEPLVMEHVNAQYSVGQD